MLIAAPLLLSTVFVASPPPRIEHPPAARLVLSAPLTPQAVAPVKKSSSRLVSALVGLGVGAGVGALLGTLADGLDDCEHCHEGLIHGAAIGGIAGAALGALLPPTRSSPAAAPMQVQIGRRGVGFRGVIRWR